MHRYLYVFTSNLKGVDYYPVVIVRTVVALGQNFGLEVISEGVETVEQRNFLAVYGCHHFQGYLYSTPLPPDEFEKLIKGDSKNMNN